MSLGLQVKLLLHWENLYSGFRRFVWAYIESPHITNIPTQVARDEQLLNIAKDYFHFVTKFFEVINISSPHIYHSALEISPESSIIRELYHNQYPNTTPWVVCGVPHSWSQPPTIRDHYQSYTWLPCGNFFSMQTPASVDIQDALT